MKNRLHIWLMCFFLSCSSIAFSTHIVGGSLTYIYNGGSNYTITLKLYRDCSSGTASFPSSVTINVEGFDGAAFSPSKDININLGAVSSVPPSLDPCAVAPNPMPCVQQGIYSLTVNNLPPNPGGYHLSYQVVARNIGLSNVNATCNCIGESFYAYIPGTSLVWNEDFTLANNTVIDNGSTAWSIAAGTPAPGSADVDNNLFEITGANSAQETWTSQVISTSSCPSVNLSVNLSENGNLDPNDSIFVYYRLDGGALIPFSTNGFIKDDFSNAVSSASGLVGSNIQIVIRVHYDGSSPSSEIYRFDNVLVSCNDFFPNSNPVFTLFPPIFICVGEPFTFDHSATDADGDSLVYSFYTPYNGENGNGPLDPSYSGNIASFTPVVWQPGYSATNPLGGAPLNLNSSTGLLTGTASALGQFVVGVMVKEYRDGVCIGQTLRDFQFNVVNCPQPPPPFAGTDIIVNQGCTNQMTASGYTAATVVWNSIYPDAFGAYNNYLSCTSGCLNPMATGQTGAPPYVDYQICGVSSACNAAFACDTVRVIFNFTLVATIVPQVPTICVGQTSTTLTAYGSGGTPPYSYLWNNVNTSQSILVGNGTYTVKISDVSGCPPAYATVTVTSYSVAISADAGPDQTICNQIPIASLNATVLGASGGSWSGGAGTFSPDTASLSASYSPTNAELAAGFVDLLLTTSGSGSCPPAFDTVRINYVGFSGVVSSSSTPVSCFGGSNGSATVSIAGGTPNFTYSWNSVPSQSTATATNLSIGTYTVTITNGIGCTSANPVTVTQPSPLALASSITNVACSAGNNGSISLIPSGGVAPYTYLWQPGNQTTSSINSQPAGTYTVTVTDTNACQKTSIYIITEPSTILIVLTPTPVTCFNGSNGKANSSVTGGTAPYAYNWSSGATSPNASGLQAGTYTLTVTDNSGCTASNSVSITEPSAVIASATVTNETCNYLDNGDATAVSSGGIAGYTYLWQPGLQTTGTIANLSAGTYTLTATDSNGCNATAFATITEPAPIVINFISQVNVSCFAGNDGVVTASPTGGTPNYSYLWASGGAITASISNLSAGTYSVTVTDSKGCTSTNSVFISQPTLLSASTTTADETCNYLNNGTATANSSGGTPGYAYLWQPGLQTTAAVSNLSAATYTLTITDSKGCTSTASAVITEPAAIAISFTGQTNVSCFAGSNGIVTASPSGGTAGYTYLWTSGGATTATIANLSAGTYTVAVTDSKGCTSTNAVVITQPAVFSASTLITNETCNYLNNGTATVSGIGGTPGYTYLWSNSATTASISNLSAATYTVTLTDSKGCTATTNAIISEPAPIVISFTAQTNVSCFPGNNGSVTASPTGGTPNYTYSWSFGGATTASISNLSAGSYSVTVTDSKGCTSTNAVVITQPTIVSAGTTTVNETCNYLNNGTATAISSGGTAGYTYLWQPGLQTSATITNLSSATYTLTVTDSKGCTATTNAVITEPAAIAISFTGQTNVSCFAGSNGSVTASPSGGTAGYTYLWASGGANAAINTGLSAGTYTVTVTDTKGCTSTNTVVITQPPVFSASTSITNETCNYLNDGTATVTGTGGTPGYTYLWSTGATTASISNLSTGTYPVTLTDSKGCIASTNAIIAEPAPVVISFTAQTNVSCFAGSDGSVTANPTGGTPNYTYSWTPGAANTASIINLSAGTYTVAVNDSKGCTSTNAVVITQPTIVSSNTTSINETCNYLNNGSASAVPTGGTPGYTYLWQPGLQTTGTINNLSTGTYTITVTDSKGCTATTNAIIAEPSAIAISFTGQTNVSCFAGSNGAVTASPSGGTPGYTYLWAAGSATIANNTGLSAGTYTVTVTDTKGCTSTNNVVITQPPVFSASTSITNETCNYLNDGTATVTGIGGTPGYTYLWSNGATTASLSNLSTGTYPVTLTDTKGCTASTNAIIAEPAPIIISFIAQTNVSCFAGNDGSVTASPSGGTPNYSYSWTSGGATTASISNLSAGTYIVTVSDSKGCTSTNSVVITQPTIVSASASTANETCNYLNNGTATAIAGGGVAGYTYLWQPGLQTTGTITNLSSGTYTLAITDSKGCTSTTNAVITEPSPIAISFTGQTNVSCFAGNDGSATASLSGGSPGYTYLWASGGTTTASKTNLSAGTYTVTVTDNSGCTSTNAVVITQPAVLSASTSITNETCDYLNDGTAAATGTGGTPGYTYLWSNGLSTQSVSNLSAATYTVTVSDSKGCTTSATAIISEPAPIVISFTAQTNVSCFAGSDGSVTAGPTGGTPNYSYSWTSGGATTASISNLSAGTFTVTVSDSKGCTSTNAVVITQPTIVTASASSSNETCNYLNNGTATAISSGGTPGYTYLWQPGLQTTGTISNLSSGTYTLTVTDSKGCTSTSTAVITEPSAISISFTGQTNVSCFAGSDGSVTASSSGGTPGYTYLWASGGTTSATKTNLPAGTYVVTVTDNSGCTSTNSVVITQPPVLSAGTSKTNESCNYMNNGAATAIQAGGTPGYTYLWQSGSSTTNSISNLAAGTYTLIVTDSKGCTANATAIITEPAPLAVSFSAQTNVSCFAGNDGFIAANPSGGTPNYSYLWAPGGTTTASKSNLSVGTFTVTITDSKGCTATNSVTITQPLVALSVSVSSLPVSCYGGTSGSVSSSASGGTGPYTYNSMPGNIAGQNVPNLAAGTYTVTATDSKGCTASTIVTVTQPPQIVLTTTSVNSDCGNPNGQISVSVTGGNTPYSYLWAPSGGTDAVADSLISGAYSVMVTDFTGCTASHFGNVNENSAPIASIFSVTNVSCYGGSTGSAQVGTTGGIGPFTYSWMPSGGNDSIASGLTAGTYTVTVTGANGCQSLATTSPEITQPPTTVITVSTSAVSCFGGGDGTATAIATGGTPGFTYQWLPSGTAGSSIGGLSATTYTIQVTDSNSCVNTQPLTIIQPAAVLSVSLSFTPVSCFGESDGSVSSTVVGGTAPYNYNWMPGNINGQNLSNLTIGTYTITVTDSKGCFETKSITVTQPTLLTTTTSSTNSNCSLANGQASVVASGGSGAYLYQWSPSGGTNATATALMQGSYNVTVTDANGCTSTSAVSVNDNASPVATVGTSTNISCNGGSNGTATVSVTGGAGPFTYSWLPSGGADSIATGLLPGTYTVTVTDANMCSSIPAISPEITQPYPIFISLSANNVNCFGGNNGTQSVIATGGTPGYTYQWQPGGTTGSSITGLPAATYTIQVTDTNSCVETLPFTITEPSAALSVSLSFTPVSCFGGADGTVSSTVTGGTAPYNYNWMPGNINGQNLSNLTIGTYTITVTDSKGCIETNSVTATQPTLVILTTNSINSNCSLANGQASVVASGGSGAYLYQWSPSGGTNATATALMQGGYNVTVTDANGCISISAVSVNDNASPSASVGTSTNISCNGGSDGTATVSVTGGAVPFTYSWLPSGGTNSIATGLLPGTYTVTVTDANMCSSVPAISPEITQPYPILITLSQNNVSCFGGNNGTESVIASGGTPGYTYQWQPIGTTGSSISNLPASTYTIQVTDFNSCVQTLPFTITEPSAALSVSASFTPVSCFAGSDGTASSSVAGGTAPYNYNWMPGNINGQNLSNLTTGTYTITVTDSKGCTETNAVTITQPTLVILTTSSINSNCSLANGQASVVASGGSGAYLYQWSPSGGTNATATALMQGGYNVTVTDANGCISTSAVSVNDNASPVASVGTSTNISCNGGSDGTATVSVTGGAGPFTYSWLPSGGSNSTATGLLPGTYTVTVTDANMCSSIPTISPEITQPYPILISLSPTNVNCFSGNDGTASVIATGGTAGYTYQWQPIGSTGSSISNLPASTYTIQVTDINSCVQTLPFTITEPSAALSVSASFTPVSCFGGSDGTVSSTVTGGTAPYNYNWMPGNINGQNLSNLTTGTYTITVNDSKGCTETNAVTITQPTLVILTTSSINSNCSLANGQASVVASGGSGAYLYQWSPSGGTNATATALMQGGYNVTVTDANGCISTSAVSVNDNASPVASVGTSTNISCNGGSDGTATVSVTGGAGPFTYSWLPSGGSNSTATGLLPGTYTVTVTDANMCSSIPAISPEITQPYPILITLTQNNVSCFGGNNGTESVIASGGTPGYTYQWQPIGTTGSSISNLPASTYTIQVTDFNSCVQTLPFTITEPLAALSVSVSFTPVSCFGGSDGTVSSSVTGGTAPYNYNWMPGNINGQNLSNLTTGTYTITVTDSKGCTETNAVTVTQPTLVILTTSSINSNCSLANGQASVVASGGSGAYLYQWSPSGGSNDTATALMQGGYNVTVTDANGCISTSAVSVNDNASPVATVATSTNISCDGGFDGTATVSVAGGAGPFTYSWLPSGGTNSTATGLLPGTYTVTVTDANMCSSVPAVSPEITQPYPILISLSQTNVNCFSGNDGTASVIASGGTPGYTYQWQPGGTTGSSIVNLPASTYTIQVTDINSCVQTLPFTITEPAQLTSVISSSGNVSCYGEANGMASVTPNGGTPVYYYNWLPSGGNGATGTNLSAGSYTVTTTDFNGCVTSSSVSITQPAQSLSATSTGSSTSCNGGANGTASISTIGGTPSYYYQWAPSVSTSNAASGLSPGNYTILVTDSNSCQTNVSVFISEPSAILGSLSFVNPSCGLFNGSVSSQLSGGAFPYSYLWSWGASTSLGINNLGPGTYSVQITDSLNCIFSLSVNLINIPQPVLTISSFTDVSCYEGNNGSATLNITQGTAPYAINWTPSGGNSLTASSLSAGTYTVNVTDAIGCQVLDSVVIAEPTPIDVSITSVNNVLCYGGNTGSISVSTTGGTGPLYTYSWAPVSSGSSTANNLTAGSYTVNVTDQNNCIKSISMPVTEPALLSSSIISSVNPNCYGGTGSASVSVAGGVLPYSYSWSAPATGETGSTANNLIAGSYTVTVTDTNGCIANSNVLITEPQQIITIPGSDDTLCLGQSGTITATATGGVGNFYYTWQPSGAITPGSLPITPTANTTYTVVAYDQIGCPGTPATITAVVYTLSGANVQAYATSPICPGQSSAIYVETSGTTGPLTYQWSNNLGTGPGVYLDSPAQATTYVVTVYNVCGLYVSDSVEVLINEQPTISLSSDPTELCAFGAVQFTDSSVTGNVNDPITTWYWDFGDGTSSNEENPYHIFNQAGTFSVTLTITTDGGCTTDNATSPLTITAYPPPVAAFSLNSTDLLIPYDVLICNNQSAGANSYSWNFGDGGTSTEENPNYLYTLSGVFQVQLIAMSQYGCLDTAYSEVTTNANIIFPNVFTPNPDGAPGGSYTLFDLSNDVFFPYTYGVIEYKLEVFNRWGEEIFESLDIKTGWDGYYRGQLCPQDVYVWKAYIMLNNGKIYNLNGNLTLLR